MGQCISTANRDGTTGTNANSNNAMLKNKITKKTLRGDDDGPGVNVSGAVRFNLGDGSEIYRGMKVMGVV